MSFDPTKVVKGHVQWWLLTAAEQADLLANYPMRPAAAIPADATVTGDAVDPRFEQWLDGAYLARHSTDTLSDDTSQG